MLKPISKNQEDYLETIFHLITEDGLAATQKIAEHLSISPASVSENLIKLAHNKLIKYSPYEGATLTRRGKRLALRLVRRHRLAEQFLVNKLGVKWARSHEEAHQLEHGISKLTGEQMDKVLGRPKTCPHGNPIPDVRGKIKQELSYPLLTLNQKDKVKIIKITDEETKLLRYLAALGLMPQTELEIQEKALCKGPIIIRVGRSNYAISQTVAKSIWVKKI
ncbi:MAG: metal-dependent transcriptional regulator [bacterium]|nr:metal-dependent transcriptional regulator [bacterium]